jgi:hypothetical protein
MPREKDLLDTIETQARHVLKLIEGEIADLEERLSKLRDQHARWTAVLVGSPDVPQTKRAQPARVSAATKPKVRQRRAPKPARPTSTSVDWSQVLESLPQRFTTDDLDAATASLGGNRRARILAIARWSRAQQICKLVEGVYEKATERPRKRIEAADLPAGDAPVHVSGRPEGASPSAGTPEADIGDPAA